MRKMKRMMVIIMIIAKKMRMMKMTMMRVHKPQETKFNLRVIKSIEVRKLLIKRNQILKRDFCKEPIIKKLVINKRIVI